MKEFRKNSLKITQKTILSCMVIAAVTAVSCPMVKAEENKSVVTTSSSEANLNNTHKFLVDAAIKDYEDIRKLEKVTDFKFKLPNFFPEGTKLQCIQLIKISDNNNAIQLYYNGDGKHVLGDISFQISKTDPVEAIKKIETDKMKTTKNPKVEAEEKSMKVGDINGTSLSLSITSPSEKLENGFTTKEFKESGKYFIWQEGGVYYSIKYNSTVSNEDKKEKEYLALSENLITKITKSIVYPSEIKVNDYLEFKQELSTETGVMGIYDSEDLKNAEKLLGFSPKLPIKINDDIKINDSVVGLSSDSDIKNNKISYELNSFYSNKKGSITFNEGKKSKEYDDIKKNGYLNEKNWKTNEMVKINVDKLNVNNMEVFKYKDLQVEKDEEQCMCYMWKENDIYYSVIFFGQADNSDEIIKTFVNSKPMA
ncbi:peptidase M56, BlaR1 [Clostridium saccharoperbutylacetonicum]